MVHVIPPTKEAVKMLPTKDAASFLTLWSSWRGSLDHLHNDKGQGDQVFSHLDMSLVT